MRIALMAVLVAVSTPAFAGDNPKTASVDGQAAEAQTQTAKTEDPGERIICKRIDATESRLGAKKVCLTANQWKQRERENSEF